MNHRISAGAITEREGHILLVRYQPSDGRDFWVAPGGGAEGTEDLPATARRETMEETGIEIRVGRMLYIEEFHDTVTRFCKVWFAGSVADEAMPRETTAAKLEGITETTWLSRAEICKRMVFPDVLMGRYWEDRDSGFSVVRRLPMHLLTR